MFGAGLRRQPTLGRLRWYCVSMATEGAGRTEKVRIADIIRTSSSFAAKGHRRSNCSELHRQTALLASSIAASSRALSTTSPIGSTPVYNKSDNINNELLLYMWGTDTKGCLLKQERFKDENISYVPQLVDAEWKQMIYNQDSSDNNNLQIASVVCGPTDTALILTDGRCYVCGENKYGQLGQGHAQSISTLTEVILPVEDPAKTKVKQVSLGNMFAAYVDTAGDLYTAGHGGSTFGGMGNLGHGDAQPYTTPKLVESLVEDGCSVQKVVVGESHMTVLTTEGEILTTGAGSYGRLGNFETIDQLYLDKTEILSPESGIIDISGGKSFTLALTKDGVLYSWGRNHKGQLGTGLGLSVDIYAMQSVPEPIETDELVNRKVVKVAAGHSHAACITDSGEMFFWGMTLHFEPVKVDALSHTKVVDISCGEDYTLAIDEDGKMYSFGKNKTGVLGQGNVKRLNQATHMKAFGSEAKIRQASAGWKHAACLINH